jgi:hypothetical protein
LGYVSHLHNLKVKDNGGSTKAQTNPTETFFPVGKRKRERRKEFDMNGIQTQICPAH